MTPHGGWHHPGGVAPSGHYWGREASCKIVSAHGGSGTQRANPGAPARAVPWCHLLPRPPIVGVERLVANPRMIAGTVCVDADCRECRGCRWARVGHERGRGPRGATVAIPEGFPCLGPAPQHPHTILYWYLGLLWLEDTYAPLWTHCHVRGWDPRDGWLIYLGPPDAWLINPRRQITYFEGAAKG